MKVIFEKDNNIKSDEVIIKYKTKDDLIIKLEKYVNCLDDIKLPFYKDNQEYYLNVDEILFFETNDNSISAHTINNMYNVKYKLYELESILPNNFLRVSKSTILNINQIFSINKNITSSSLIEFYNTHKKVYVSRFYYKNIKERLKERFK